MARTAECTVFIGDGEYTAALRIGELMKLQERTGFGPFKMAMRLAEGEWFVQEIVETIRFGLMGAEELSHKEISDLINTFVVSGDLNNYVLQAQTIINAAVFGPTDEEPLETPEAEEGDEAGNPLAP